MANDFLFELGVEELPSALVASLGNALKIAMNTAFEKAKLSYTSLQTFATPRRLALFVKGLCEEQPSQKLSRRGPARVAAYDTEGQPTSALEGFARSCGVTIADLSLSQTDKGEWFVFESEQCGVKTKELLPSLISEAISHLPIKKPMRWGEGEVEFARPVHWVVMLWGTEILPCQVLGMSADRKTYGHRFLAEGAIEIEKPEDYEPLLQEAYVIADFAKRKSIIMNQITAAASQHEAQPIMPEALLEEVTSIVEWPETLVAQFEKNFLEVPQEALIASMQVHQKCFPLQNEQGQLLPLFIAVTNLKSINPKQVIAGNERVMRARLSDAAFFFTQDKLHPLSQHRASTAQVIFQNRLGSLYDKTLRMQHLMQCLTPLLLLKPEQAERAVQLSKCDLMTGMVGEFPELQGTMGYYYAHHDGEMFPVAQALQEQYLPRFSGDVLPVSPLGAALSLVDRLDTLVGIFALNQKPSGDKDPFKLRRHALAIARLLMNQPQPIHLSFLIGEALKAYGSLFKMSDQINTDIKTFIIERLVAYYQAKKIPIDRIQAVAARQNDWLYDFNKRMDALVDFIKQKEARNLSAACKRVNNLLQQNVYHPSAVDETLLSEAAEQALYQQLKSIENKIEPLYEQGNYAEILSQLALLCPFVDAFFDQVMVAVENERVKANRLSLLRQLQQLLQGVADISLLQLS